VIIVDDIDGHWRDLGRVLAARSPDNFECMVEFLEHVTAKLTDATDPRDVNVKIVGEGDARRVVATHRITAPAPTLTAEQYELLGQLASRESTRVAAQDPVQAGRLSQLSARCARMAGRAKTAKPTGES
jgi:hypothetical protein